MKSSRVKALFIVHKFEVKKLVDSAGYLEVIRPMVASGYLSDHRVLSFGRELDYYQDIVEQRLFQLRQELHDAPIVIYGAGAHTRQFLDELTKLNVVAFADRDEKLWGTQRFGYPVIAPSLAPSVAGDVVISSRAYEASILSELQTIYPSSVGVHSLYGKSVDYDQSHMTNEISDAVSAFQPDLIIYTPTHPSENIGSAFFLDLKARNPSLKIVNVWWDYDECSENGSYLDYERDCLLYSDFVVENSNYSRLQKMLRQEAPYHNHKNVEKVHFHPTTFDPSLFYPSQEAKTVDIALWGSSVGERTRWIDVLAHTYGKRFKQFGGVYHGDEPLPAEEYAAMYRQTKIAVNTQTYPFRTQCKGKVREALCSGTFLLEEDNLETKAFVPEGCGVSYFNSEKELKSKIEYYLEHPKEREEIENRGRDWLMKNHSPQKWTYKILFELGFVANTMEIKNEI